MQDLGEPSNVLEAAALELRARLPEGARIAGVERWIGRMRTTDVPLDFHHDRDLALFRETGEILHPTWSSVLYFNRVRGGSLLVTDQRLRRRGDALVLVPAEAARIATVRPAPNRFAFFPGRFLHGVLDANNAVPHGKVPGPPARPRLSVVYNWWRRRPHAVPAWTERRRYRELALPRG